MRRSKLEREADLVNIAALYRRGWTMREISDIITQQRPYSISHVMVKHDLDLVLKRWKEKQSKYIDNFVTVQLEQIQEMKQELWQEYLRSKKPAKTVKEKRTTITGIKVNPKPVHEELSDLELDKLFEDYTNDSVEEDETPLEEVDITFMNLSDKSIMVDQSVQIDERLGNPRYLELIDKLMDREAKLLGKYDKVEEDSGPAVVVVTMPPPVSKDIFMPAEQLKLDE